jgi:hypothetical protein
MLFCGTACSVSWFASSSNVSGPRGDKLLTRRLEDEMQLGMIGLSRMGPNLTRRLMQDRNEFGRHVKKAAAGAR